MRDRGGVGHGAAETIHDLKARSFSQHALTIQHTMTSCGTSSRPTGESSCHFGRASIAPRFEP